MVEEARHLVSIQHGPQEMTQKPHVGHHVHTEGGKPLLIFYIPEILQSK